MSTRDVLNPRIVEYVKLRKYELVYTIGCVVSSNYYVHRTISVSGHLQVSTVALKSYRLGNESC